MLAYAVVQQHMSWLTLCMLTYEDDADVWGRMLTYAGVCCGAATHELADAMYADACGRMLTYADVC